ncbi:bifunctional diguanylate cyclase/phosphodiesterase [Aureimonas sp. AU12]|uniref:putative bifunctional diguanylate cyclase/phosphodiesterase n=1 Tax=Aureimonas sp. AU12 TaxID=1638161 RepID=UPI0007801C74|nr:bifunctional diguanylate cyclase/phosphodiesterase [Aureimonas sp. AU12]
MSRATTSARGRTHGHRVRLGLTIVTIGLALLTVASTVLAWGYQFQIADASRYNGTFDLNQATVELLRLEAELDAVRHGNGADAARLRYAILRNRTAILRSGDAMSMLTAYPTQTAAFGRFNDIVDGLQPLIDQLPRQEAAQSALAILKPFDNKLVQLASLSNVATGDVVAKNQKQLEQIFIASCLVTMTLVAFGALLLTFVFRQNRHLVRVANTDTLTGLGNRFAFNAALARADDDVEQAVALLDVDHFKLLNDSLGHDAGDLFLVELSKRLAAVADEAELVARLGGDEFALFFCGPSARERAVHACEKIGASMATPIALQDRDLTASVSIGVGFKTREDAPDSASLLKDADIALYGSKAAGRACYRVFDPTMKQKLLRRQRLQDDLALAVAAGELALAFQPIIDLSTDRLGGFEALLRWRHPELGFVSPAEFIPVAEESQQIEMLGRWVLTEACRQAAGWPSHLSVAVNVSARQLTDECFPMFVAENLNRFGIRPRMLEIEITESVLIENDEQTLRVLQALRDLGVRISLDDFGTGYSSLSYLRRFTFDKIKIDQSFVRSAANDESSGAIIATICALAARLHLDIVAEGIETAAHLDFVREAGCRFGQGYLFDKPLSVADCAARIIADRLEDPAQRSDGPSFARAG